MDQDIGTTAPNFKRQALGEFDYMHLAQGDELEHPETAYRRGYQQGAMDAVRGLEAGATRAELENWVLLTLYRWRYRKPETQVFFPPRWRNPKHIDVQSLGENRHNEKRSIPA